MVQIKKESVRKKILEAAEAQFAKVGFKKTTVGGVAQEASVATGNIYKYFKNKKDLFDAVVTQEFVDEFSELTRIRVDRFKQTKHIDPRLSLMEGEAGRLLRFLIQNRLKVIIILTQSEGTQRETFFQNYLEEVIAQTLEQACEEYPKLEITNLMRFTLTNAIADSIKGIVLILEHFDNQEAILEALDANTTFYLGGMRALAHWSSSAH